MQAGILVALACASSVHAASIAEAVFEIESSLGNDPAAVIERLRPLEAGARASGGDDLRTFLSAWGYAHGAMDKPAVADAAVEELTDLGERQRDPAALASAYALKACLLSFAGRTHAAFGWIEAALPLLQEQSSPDLRYWVYSTAGDLASADGQVGEALRTYEAALTAAQQGRNPRREAQVLLALAPLRIVTGNVPGALRDAARARALGARSTTPRLVVTGWVMESFAAIAGGQAARGVQARAAATQAERAFDAVAGPMRADADAINSQAGPPSGLSTDLDTLLTFSRLHLSLRNYLQAHDFAHRAQRLAEDRHDDGARAHASIDLGMADIGLGRAGLGRQEAHAGLQVLERHQRDSELLIQLNRYIALLERCGETAEALARMRESLLLENELARRDRQSTVVALQRQSSQEQHLRHLEQLEHENALQSSEIARRTNERTLTLLLAAAMGLGVAVAWSLYVRARRSNRQLAETNEKLAFASLHDKVTGLLNRRAMEADTETVDGGPYCYVTISVKQFGLIVGSVGHQQGDTLLCQIAARLDQVVQRHQGRLYRVDGVTFGALFRFSRDEPRLRCILDALAGAMDAGFAIGNQDVMVSLGMGASEYPKDAGSAQEVARLAELAKLCAQADPGNSWLVYDTRLGESQRDKLGLESRLLKALEHGDFELYYQGQRGLPGGRICGFEALLRWRDGQTMIPPAQFIPLAEETGLIVRIGTWVLREACRQARAWADSGAGKPLVAINISPRQFNHPDFLATVRETLHATGVDPRQIELEITEGSVMDDAEASIVQLHALRELGLHLAIDDFGTGYASLSYLRRFPLDRLKIDRSFIMQLNASEQDDTIVRTVIELAHTLGLSVTAEGVETLEQEALLARWGCDVIQGFLHFRPAPAATATSQLEQDKT